VLEIWGDGTGIENGERQFQLSPADVKRAVRAFPGSRPGVEKTAEAAREWPHGAVEARIRVRGQQVALRHSKSKPPAGLDEIVKEVSAVCEPALANAITVKSIPEGLGGIASGRVSPRALTLQFTALEEVPVPEGARPGFIVSIRGRTGMLTLSGATGSRPPAPFTLTEDEFRALVTATRTAAPKRFRRRSRRGLRQLVVTVLGTNAISRRALCRSRPATKTAQARTRSCAPHRTSRSGSVSRRLGVSLDCPSGVRLSGKTLDRPLRRLMSSMGATAHGLEPRLAFVRRAGRPEGNRLTEMSLEELSP
jgi:hypothetical protein